MKQLLLSSLVIAAMYACNNPNSATGAGADSTSSMETTPPSNRPGTMESDSSTMLPSDTSSTTDTSSMMNRP